VPFEMPFAFQNKVLFGIVIDYMLCHYAEEMLRFFQANLQVYQCKKQN
jgi:hypothetical protein